MTMQRQVLARRTEAVSNLRTSQSVAPFAGARAALSPKFERNANSLDINALANAPPVVHEVLSSPGRPLDLATRAFFEPRYGHDFSRVRVHTDSYANESAGAVSAVAYTVGSDIVFDQNHYRPQTAQGRRLLAHELAHVVEQSGTTNPGANLKIGASRDPAERAADVAAEQVLNGDKPAQLDTTGASSTLRRETKESWAGFFDNDLQYDLKSENNGKGEGAYGATMQLRFTPKSVVRADKVALVQTAASSWNDENYFIGSAGQSKATESRSTPSGTHIDQINPSTRTPIVAMKDPPSASGDLAASIPGRNATFGMPAAEDKGDRQATLFDPARIASVPDGAAASQRLETAALAVSGPQKGVYFGSVQWGWEKAADAKAATLKPFQLISTDAPSSEFGLASELWNRSMTDQKQQRLALPVATGKFIVHASTPLMDHAEVGKEIVRLDLNTRVEVTGQVDDKHPDWSSIIVTEDPKSKSKLGMQGWVRTKFLSDMTRKKSL